MKCLYCGELLFESPITYGSGVEWKCSHCGWTFQRLKTAQYKRRFTND